MQFGKKYDTFNYKENEMQTKYYDGTKLLSMKDINGNKPEIFVCTSNRTAGKTTYFGRLLVNRYKKQGKRFGLIYRFGYELDDVSNKFFKDIGELFFRDNVMTDKKMGKGAYSELFLDGESCGFAFVLNQADQIKRMSHLFSDVDSLLFDEFQSETNHYCPNELTKFQSLHTSIARGQGEQVRYVPVYMIGNPVSVINPYYTAWGFSSRITNKMRFLKGPGIVLEQGYNASAADAQKTSGFNQAFSGSDYQAYAAESVYLNDNLAFIEKPEGQGRYIGTVKYEGKNYGIREYADLGIVYCDDHPDNTFPLRISATKDDHDINYVMIRKNELFIGSLRYYFETGAFRFKDLKSKEAIFRLLSI